MKAGDVNTYWLAARCWLRPGPFQPIKIFYTRCHSREPKSQADAVSQAPSDSSLTYE
jgi:hypothetical protein